MIDRTRRQNLLILRAKGVLEKRAGDRGITSSNAGKIRSGAGISAEKKEKQGANECDEKSAMTSV